MKGARTSGPCCPSQPLIAAVLVVSLSFSATVHAERRPRGPEGVLAVLAEIEQHLVETRYQHMTVIRASRGQYFLDCSGLAEHVLRRGAPIARRMLGWPMGRRPLAREYYRFLRRIPPGGRRGAWHRLGRASDAAPGDLIAWERPRWFRSPHRATGHVAFVVSRPRLVSGPVPGLLVRIADAAASGHQRDTRGRGGSGFGMGDILLTVDERGQANGYGWVGTATPAQWIVPTEIVIARPLR